jgi:hypothetical protein
MSGSRVAGACEANTKGTGQRANENCSDDPEHAIVSYGGSSRRGRVSTAGSRVSNLNLTGVRKPGQSQSGWPRCCESRMYRGFTAERV